MKKISIIAATLALGVPATAYAAGDCCKGMECCKNGAECCKDGKGDCCKEMRQGGDPAGHEMHGDHEGHVPSQPN